MRRLQSLPPLGHSLKVQFVLIPTRRPVARLARGDAAFCGHFAAQYGLERGSSTAESIRSFHFGPLPGSST